MSGCILVNSRLCSFRLRGFCRVTRHRDRARNLFDILAYAPTGCSSDTVKDEFYMLLRTAHRANIVILAGDINVRQSPEEEQTLTKRQVWPRLLSTRQCGQIFNSLLTTSFF